MPSVIRDYKKLYMLLVPEGLDISEIMSKISDSAIHRGFSVEQYYSPMNPIDGIEHVLIPEIKIGFMTLNGHFDYDYCETAPENPAERASHSPYHYPQPEKPHLCLSGPVQTGHQCRLFA